ncbi:hypothetical protein IVB22_26675 [Bradyrhizobium sp. 190]|uniref:hypothetical protein n=1 Tax=Bradyrhizobium sp. 190 TaxID=2782658 RepID=UPI001FFBE776|nr:hypothetical protein [Bradyrhizobium sp. 190]MCK1516075.1 hypothetical protein [Bradyrhizobium sp. 190]
MRFLLAVKPGALQREVGEWFGVSEASVSRQRTLEGQQSDARRSGRTEAHKETILAMLKATTLDMAIESYAGTWQKRHFAQEKDRARQRAGPAGCREAAAGFAKRLARAG